ncbi:uncharacterized protein LOC131647604 [Vicia villosa]|uniref:uncharacterized protein LOC131647604 n=1 Tax=Vicia villosa TaxID=3911 RepID=UPI00273A8AA2|nr:uncharacterized protein LOC131647604 [Vicia villosa]
MTVELLSKKSQYIHTRVKYHKGSAWLFSAVYASPNEDLKKSLWDDMKVIADSKNLSWLVAGDLNDIAKVEDKKGGAPVSLRKLNLFNDRVEACNLMELGSYGPKYTWRGPIFHGGQRIYEKLDRALCSDAWRLEFPDANFKVLARVDYSDHHPILIIPFSVYQHKVKRQFKFENAWNLVDSYQDMINKVWREDKAFEECLKDTRDNLENWKEHSFDNVKLRKKEIMARLKGVHCRLQRRDNVKALRKLEVKLQEELRDILAKEELMWFQRSRTRWLADGDRNTKYYHMKKVNWRRKNKISMLKDDQGNWVEDESDLKELVNNFYKSLFEINYCWKDWLLIRCRARIKNELFE